MFKSEGSAVFSNSPGSPTSASNANRTAHEEATVEGVMNRWRVRPIYDNYSATVAPSAPDTMSVFLSLRADLLKSSLNVDERNAAENDDDFRSDEEDDEGADGDVHRTVSGRGGATAKSLYRSASTSSNTAAKDRQQRRQQRRDDYTVRQLKGELSRLLEQLQISNAESVQLRNQIAGMTKELSARQRRIVDLEEVNRTLTEENNQLQQSVAELGMTVNTIEESNHAQLMQNAGGRGGTSMASFEGGGGGGASMLMMGGGSSVMNPTASSRQRGASMNAGRPHGASVMSGASNHVHWQ